MDQERQPNYYSSPPCLHLNSPSFLLYKLQQALSAASLTILSTSHSSGYKHPLYRLSRKCLTANRDWEMPGLLTSLTTITMKALVLCIFHSQVWLYSFSHGTSARSRLFSSIFRLQNHICPQACMNDLWKLKSFPRITFISPHWNLRSGIFVFLAVLPSFSPSTNSIFAVVFPWQWCFLSLFLLGSKRSVRAPLVFRFGKYCFAPWWEKKHRNAGPCASPISPQFKDLSKLTPSQGLTSCKRLDKNQNIDLYFGFVFCFIPIIFIFIYVERRQSDNFSVQTLTFDLFTSVLICFFFFLLFFSYLFTKNLKLLKHVIT